MNEKQVLLKKGDDIVLFVKSEKASTIKLVNLDLREHIILDQPMEIRT